METRLRAIPHTRQQPPPSDHYLSAACAPATGARTTDAGRWEGARIHQSEAAAGL